MSWPCTLPSLYAVGTGFSSLPVTLEGMTWSKNRTNTVIELLRCLGVKVEVFEEFRCPVLLVTFTVTTLPSQVAPGVLQLQETHPLQE